MGAGNKSVRDLIEAPVPQGQAVNMTTGVQLKYVVNGVMVPIFAEKGPVLEWKEILKVRGHNRMHKDHLVVLHQPKRRLRNK